MRGPYSTRDGESSLVAHRCMRRGLRRWLFPLPIVLGVVFLLAPACRDSGWEEDPGGGGFTLEQLRADFDQLRGALESNHPDLYRYETPTGLEVDFASARDSLRGGMSEAEFFRTMAPLVARCHCGHTSIRHSARFYNALEASGLVLPLGIYLDGGTARIDADYGSNSGIPLGSEVLAINGREIAEVVERMKAGISADARNDSAKAYRLNRSFFLYYHLFWGETPGFSIRFRPQEGGTESTATVVARPYAQVNPLANKRFPGSSRLAMTVAGGVALLTVPTFVAGQNPDYDSFFETAFRNLNEAGVTRLVVDLRGNGGGAPEVSVALISHLIDHPFVYFKKGQGYPQLFSATTPHPVHFPGTTLVLIDGGCFSTSGHFCALVRHHGLALFVGETGGGTFRCHDNSLEIALAQSGMRLRVARTTYEAAVPDEDVSGGFHPDFRVLPGIGDVLAGTDVQMEFALRRLRGE